MKSKSRISLLLFVVCLFGIMIINVHISIAKNTLYGRNVSNKFRLLGEGSVQDCTSKSNSFISRSWCSKHSHEYVYRKYSVWSCNKNGTGGSCTEGVFSVYYNCDGSLDNTDATNVINKSCSYN